MTENRNIKIDVLRIIGLIGVILAHVSPPNFVMQMRTFDVPLMVIVSGIAYDISYKGSSLSSYYFHRLGRLLAPVWTFLVIYFFYFKIVDMFISGQTINFDIIIRSYILLNNGGIGYVWIVRVFILVAIGSPMIYFIHRKIENSLIYFFFIVLLFLVYFRLVDIIAVNHFNKTLDLVVNEYVLYFIPYTLFFAIGLRLNQLSIKQLIILVILTILMFVYVCLSENVMKFSNLSLFKYPPQELWVIYGVMISSFLFLILNNNMNLGNWNLKAITFMSASSLWIYLWHIFLLKNWSYAISHVPSFANHYVAKLIIITSAASLITFFQKRFCKYLLIKFKPNDFTYNLVTICFLK